MPVTSQGDTSAQSDSTGVLPLKPHQRITLELFRTPFLARPIPLTMTVTP